jgi:hypothetical protein
MTKRLLTARTGLVAVLVLLLAAGRGRQEIRVS